MYSNEISTMTRVRILHLSGSRQSQQDVFHISTHPMELLFGRDIDCTIRFDPFSDDVVSRRHALLTVTADLGGVVALLTDLSSSNGLFVNQQRIQGTITLAHNDTLQMGLQGPMLRFELDPAPELTAPGPAPASLASLQPSRTAVQSC